MSTPGSDPNHGGAGAVRDGASGISGTETASALQTAADSCETAYNVVGGRLSAWVSVLTTAADTYSGTDDQASKRVAALGDFNGSWAAPKGPTPVTVPTRSQINGFQLEKFGDSLGTDHRPRSTDQVRWCACRDAITELAWDGDGANAAELRAEDEYHEFRRTAIELEDMSESVSSGLSWLSDTSNSLKLRVVSCQLQKFDVNDDWVVIDKFDYASADTDESTEDTALREQRAEIAKTETVLLQQLAQTFSDQGFRLRSSSSQKPQ